MTWTAKTRIHLPFSDVIKEPGDSITKKEMEDANQSVEDIARLIDDDAMEED